MDEEKALQEGSALVARSTIAMLGTNGDGGHPNIRAMIKVENEALKTIWFSTNTSSRKMAQIERDARACVYFVDFEKWMGLMLVGTVEILQDAESRHRLWQKGWERYYPQGVDDPDYSVLRFSTHWGRFYHGLSHVNFEP
jgi:general stress protein 26